MGLTLDIGCGPNKFPNAIGVDKRLIQGVDVVCDIERELPFKTSSVDLIWMRHVIEHVGNLIGFMEEVYRVCRHRAAIEIVVPYYTSRGAFRDPKIPFSILSLQPTMGSARI